MATHHLEQIQISTAYCEGLLEYQTNNQLGIVSCTVSYGYPFFMTSSSSVHGQNLANNFR